MNIKAAVIWGGAAMCLIFLIWVSADRVDLLLNSSLENAVVASCDGKPPAKRHRLRRRNTSWSYAPVAVTSSGVKVKGSIALSRKSWCERLIGAETSVFVHNANKAKSRINSFFQLWILPAFFLTLAICIIGSGNRTVWSTAFFGFFIVTGLAAIQEFRLLGGQKVSQPEITDLALNQCVQNSMRKEGARSEHTLKKLTCVNIGIGDINKLSQFHSLEELYLQSNNITSLKPLRHLKKLRKLNITNNKKLTSLDGLENLHELEELRAHSMKINDISALQNLNKLRILSLGRNKIEDISALAGLKQLETLMMAYNPIRTIESLQGKPKLETLVFYGSPIADITPLYENSGLRTVGIRGQSSVPCDQFSELRNRLPPEANVVGEKRCG